MPARSRARRAPAVPPAPAVRFDRAYYERFYLDPASRVSDAAAVARLVDLVAAWARYLELPLRHVLDLGCGLGHWRDAVRARWPQARHHGVEVSEHLCARHGWTRGSVVDFDPAPVLGRERFDLVVCQGVLQYLTDREAAAALANLARCTEGLLYLEVLTRRDWQRNCDRTRTDGKVHLRDGAWYRRRLGRHFVACGGGVFVARRAGVTLFELEGT
jgi:SAM-dependent methyltransferase